ncbi:metallophosphatase family protein [Rhodocaloribacter litoris]|uniref:metallophosphoesterase family protein n=1 Tax=Rhodocaloribacter litoris TaxID=2558931 RepID=UPI00141EAB5D|nr:metallophosphoesterase family protein [Rhodocaloribacter litoris]QXD16797.1 metallophosphatase family protein [Rhodocaloribacter litoris]GIV61085.1 MAG: phosphoesterase [Rhodothermaceae bacterium]
MRLAVLSDVHDHLWHLDAALEVLEEVEVLICCGDLCSPFVMKRLADGFAGEIHVVFGNNDADTFRITRIAQSYGERVRLHGEFARLERGGRLLAVHHFDDVARDLAASGRFDVVCFGHNHVWEVSREVAGDRRVLLLNPGPIMGVRFDRGRPVPVPPTFAVYDTETGSVERWTVETGAASCRAVSQGVV